VDQVSTLEVAIYAGGLRFDLIWNKARFLSLLAGEYFALLGLRWFVF